MDLLHEILDVEMRHTSGWKQSVSIAFLQLCATNRQAIVLNNSSSSCVVCMLIVSVICSELNKEEISMPCWTAQRFWRTSWVPFYSQHPDMALPFRLILCSRLMLLLHSNEIVGFSEAVACSIRLHQDYYLYCFRPGAGVALSLSDWVQPPAEAASGCLVSHTLLV